MLFQNSKDHTVTSLSKIRFTALGIVCFFCLTLFVVFQITPRPLTIKNARNITAYIVSMPDHFEPYDERYVGANIFALPNAEIGYDRLAIAMPDLNAMSLPYTRYTIDSMPMEKLPSVNPYFRPPPVSAMALWALESPQPFLDNIKTLPYPQFEINGVRSAWQIQLPPEIKKMLSHAHAPTTLFLMPATSSEFLPTIRLDQSCGHQVLDQLAVKHFSHYETFKALGIQHNQMVKVYWNDTKMKEEGTR